MVNAVPVNNPRRLMMEAGIRIVDLFIYGFILCSGFAAMLVTPQSVLDQLHELQFLIGVWNVLLLVGGLAGFIGRLFRIWAIELPGVTAGAFGTAMYTVILGSLAMNSPTVWVAVTLMLVAMGTCVRRWLELHIFSSSGEVLTWRQRLKIAWERRTDNTANLG